MSESWTTILLFGGVPLLLILWRYLSRTPRNPKAAAGITRRDVIQKALSVWPSDLDRVITELDSNLGPERERVQLDAIALSHGSLEHLNRWLRNYEYREIIAAAEYKDPEVLRRFDEQTRWQPDSENEISFRELSQRQSASSAPARRNRAT